MATIGRWSRLAIVEPPHGNAAISNGITSYNFLNFHFKLAMIFIATQMPSKSYFIFWCTRLCLKDDDTVTEALQLLFSPQAAPECMFIRLLPTTANAQHTFAILQPSLALIHTHDKQTKEQLLAKSNKLGNACLNHR